MFVHILIVHNWYVQIPIGSTLLSFCFLEKSNDSVSSKIVACNKLIKPGYPNVAY